MDRPRIGDWWGYEELTRLQDVHLLAALRAAARSPFYRKLLGDVPTSRAELGEIPLTTKADLREAYPFGLLAVDRAGLATYHESSGSSGAPTSSYYTAGDWLDLAERFARKRIAVEPSDMFLVRTPYALMITGHLAHAAARMCGATVVPADNRSLAMPYSRVVRVLRDLDVTITWSLPTDTLLWAAAAAAAGHRTDRDFPALRALFVGGEPLSPARRDRIAALWGAPVVEEYGATETGSLAGECPRGRLHLWADRALFEVHDPLTGRTAPQGRGQLVVTPLFREAMPLLRYNMEDEVEVAYDACACGWWLPTVRVLGRTAFDCRTGGVPLTQTGLEELVFGLPAEFGVLFWRARAGSTHLRVEIEVADRYRAPATAVLAEAVGRTYGVEAEVVAVPPGGLVPLSLLTATADVMKPRGLFRDDEDWDRALRYY
ncbi:phenylacetate--CoA ligase family protein [Phytohabitans suffuscus]|uniref:Phenylacetate--CoA ligase n=1 Tax=Phytohabitans suffuscus TaxID=624315 RepID=A0A6F8YF98_9ACTN|nr:AMP-binding protein [Phytohabitans suffuscus]BCB84740.1 phenylacetate--CoA ligase [Phytohabitans suffuscus]